MDRTDPHGMPQMDADEIVALSPDVVMALLEANATKAVAKDVPRENRRAERWPFAGTVEVWLPEECYGDRHVLATLHNLSRDGLAMRTRRPIPAGIKISFALHQPMLSCYGHAHTRHCTQASVGYLIGVEFIFEDKDDDDE